ncbi:MAG: hypothetical protein WD576_00865 [Nitriliruptoraceae bacterium]
MSVCGRPRTPAKHQDGFVAGAETLIFGVLVFVVGTIVALNAWLVVDAKFAVSAAARAAVRTAVEADLGDDLLAAATQAAEEAFGGYRSGAAELRVIPRSALALRRCQPISIDVEADVVPLLIPRIAGARTFTVSAHHREVVDPYRSRLPLGDDCAW